MCVCTRACASEWNQDVSASCVLDFKRVKEKHMLHEMLEGGMGENHTWSAKEDRESQSHLHILFHYSAKIIHQTAVLSLMCSIMGLINTMLSMNSIEEVFSISSHIARRVSTPSLSCDLDCRKSTDF